MNKEAWRAALTHVRPSLRSLLTVIYLVLVAVVLMDVSPEMLKFGKSVAAAGLGVVLWVVSWPAWVWICLCILSAANRIVRAIDRHGSPR